MQPVGEKADAHFCVLIGSHRAHAHMHAHTAMIMWLCSPAHCARHHTTSSLCSDVSGHSWNVTNYFTRKLVATRSVGSVPKYGVPHGWPCWVRSRLHEESLSLGLTRGKDSSRQRPATGPPTPLPSGVEGPNHAENLPPAYGAGGECRRAGRAGHQVSARQEQHANLGVQAHLAQPLLLQA